MRSPVIGQSSVPVGVVDVDKAAHILCVCWQGWEGGRGSRVPSHVHLNGVLAVVHDSGVVFAAMLCRIVYLS